jgi:ribose 1,5-bisphosphokinase PhnN
MKPIVLVVGCPGSGKTFVCESVRGHYLYVPHDLYKEREYPIYLLKSVSQEKPVIGEIPFGLSKLQAACERGAKVVPVFLYEEEKLLHERWDKRGNVTASTRKGHLSRQETYCVRARELKAFLGNSSELIEHLRRLSF